MRARFFLSLRTNSPSLLLPDCDGTRLPCKYQIKITLTLVPVSLNEGSFMALCRQGDYSLPSLSGDCCHIKQYSTTKINPLSKETFFVHTFTPLDQEGKTETPLHQQNRLKLLENVHLIFSLDGDKNIAKLKGWGCVVVVARC